MTDHNTNTPPTPEAHSNALLDAARKAGASAAEVMVVQSQSVSVGVRAGALEQAERAESFEIGLRVLIGQRQACVSASRGDADTLQNLAQRAVAMAQEAPDDPHIGLAQPEQLATARQSDAQPLELHDPTAPPGPDALQERALEAEAQALGAKGISQVQQASAGYSEAQVHLASSLGWQGGYTRSGHWHSCVAIAGEGAQMERDHDGDSRTFLADLRAPRDIGRSAAERALARAGARKPPGGTFPVVFDERIAASLVGHLLAAANGTAIARGASWLRGKLGEQVLPAGLSLVEDPHRPRLSGSRPFDAEGLPTGKRTIVRNGVLTGWTLDLATARKLNMPPTANAARGVGAPPSPANWNIALDQGSESLEDLFAAMGTGLWITSLIGSTINPTTGDYSRGASGIWVENGVPTYPVNECTIAGNLLEMLSRLRPANDARPYLSRVVPSCLIEGMRLA